MSAASELHGRRALVTGAGQRVGQAVALALGRVGMRVAVHYHTSAAGAAATCASIRAAGGEAFAVQANLRDRDATRALVDRATATLNGLDLLVASAAGYEASTLDTLDDATWDRMLELDLTASFVLAQRAIPALRAARGNIVFITCASVAVPFRGYLPYVVAKGALSHLTRALALELAPEVRVNAVAPGTVLPPAAMADDERARLTARLPLQRVGSADDIARAVLYLAESPFVTGQELFVDGGRSTARIEPFG